MSSGQNSPAAIQQELDTIQKDIQNLQTLKNDLYTNLYSNTSLSTSQKQKLQTQIQQIEETYVGLQNTSMRLSGILNNLLESAKSAISTQETATSIINTELNNNKRRLSDLENDNQQKIRQIEINDYFGKKYQEHTSIMVIIIFTLVVFIILTIIQQYGLFFGNDSVYYFLVFVIGVYALYSILLKMYYLYILNNMVYGQYDFQYPGASIGIDVTGTIPNPWISTDMPILGCYGQECCTGTDVYDYDPNAGFNRCLPAATNATPSPLSYYTLAPADIGTQVNSSMGSGQSNQAIIIADPLNPNNAIINLLLGSGVALPFSLKKGATGIYTYSGQNSNQAGINNNIAVYKPPGGGKLVMYIVGPNNSVIDRLV